MLLALQKNKEIVVTLLQEHSMLITRKHKTQMILGQSICVLEITHIVLDAESGPTLINLDAKDPVWKEKINYSKLQRLHSAASTPIMVVRSVCLVKLSEKMISDASYLFLKKLVADMYFGNSVNSCKNHDCFFIRANCISHQIQLFSIKRYRPSKPFYRSEWWRVRTSSMLPGCQKSENSSGVTDNRAGSSPCYIATGTRNPSVFNTTKTTHGSKKLCDLTANKDTTCLAYNISKIETALPKACFSHKLRHFKTFRSPLSPMIIAPPCLSCKKNSRPEAPTW